MSDPTKPQSIVPFLITLTNELKAQNKNLADIAESLRAISAVSAPKAPNYSRPMTEYKNFDWKSIGATVTANDPAGVTSVEWGGFTWTRRSPQNKFATAIWFSRPEGKDADGNVRYVRLITFKAPTEAEPLPTKTEKALGAK